MEECNNVIWVNRCTLRDCYTNVIYASLMGKRPKEQGQKLVGEPNETGPNKMWIHLIGCYPKGSGGIT
jgi:hypothetical protein